ncbi:MAG TPA: hypothetical protein VF009_05090 [Solirubrobacterales bacterium]
MSAKPIKTLAVTVAALAALAAVGRAEVIQHGSLRISFEGKLNPKRLPRHGAAPVAVSVGGHVTTTDGSTPPQLRKIEIGINRHGRFDYSGLPACRLEEIQPSTTTNAMRACGPSKVGVGSFAANVAIPGQTPFPSAGKMIAFNGVEGGKPVIFAHVYGTRPVPTSFTLTLRMQQTRGTFGTTLVAYLPHVTGHAGFITGLSLNLHRTYRYRGSWHSYLSAGCPAPKGFSGSPFPLARASFTFAGGRTLGSTLVRSCKVRG